MYRLGLDIGTTSVGWAVLNIDDNGDPNKIIDLGVRIFDAAENPKDKSSLALHRREARSARRRNRRKKHRIDRIKGLLQTQNIMSRAEISDIYSKRTSLPDIYEIRCNALDRVLTKEEFSRLMIHLAKRRGFKSNRKTDKSGDDGKMLEAVSFNAEYMKEKGYRTVGEMLFKDHKYSERKHNVSGEYDNTFTRAQMEDELKLIFSRQQELGNEFVTGSFVEKYMDIYFSQRSFDDGPGGGSPYGGSQIARMWGNCTFEKNEKRAAKATYSFESFNLWQKINSIRIEDENGKHSLTDDDRKKIFDLCHEKSNVTYESIRRLLNDSLGTDFFRFTTVSYSDSEGDVDKAEKNTKFNYLPAYHEMKKVFNSIEKGYVDSVSVSKRDYIGTLLSIYKTDDKIINALNDPKADTIVSAFVGDIKDISFTSEEIDCILKMKSFDKNSNLSLKVINKALPFLEAGMTYDKAIESAGYDFRNQVGGVKKKYLPKLPEDTYDITSPVVKRSVNQTIKVVNAIIKRYGSPAFVNIELARELGKSVEARNEIAKSNKENEANNVKWRKEIEELGHKNPTGLDILKYRLWKEQNERCPYTNEPISIERLFETGMYEVDHIVPYSISLDDRYLNKALVTTKANRDKGNRVPLDYVSDKEEFITLIKANKSISRAKRNRLLTTSTEAAKDSEMKLHSLVDTQFATSFIANYIRNNLLFDDTISEKTERDSIRKRVISVNGSVTSYMRRRWGIEKIRENGDLHHAVDAVVVGCISDGIINRVTVYSQGKEQYDKKYVNMHFPAPWDLFREEVLARTSDSPREGIRNLNLETYTEVEVEKIWPVFVSRMVKKKDDGQAHKETIRSLRTIMNENGKPMDVSVVKTDLKSLKLDKNGEIQNYYNPGSDLLLYEMLKRKLVENGGDGEKAFPKGEKFFKPKADSTEGPEVKTVKTYEYMSSYVMLNRENSRGIIAANGDMVRIDLYKVEGEGYYAVPIYATDLVKLEIPIYAPVPRKPWKKMNRKDFLFSLYPNDLIEFTSSGLKTFSKNYKEANLPEKYESRSEKVYYTGFDISTASISVILNDSSYKIKGLGIKTLKSIRELNVDVLGKIYNQV